MQRVFALSNFQLLKTTTKGVCFEWEVGDEDRKKLIPLNIKEKDPSSTKGNGINKENKDRGSLSSKRWEKRRYMALSSRVFHIKNFTCNSVNFI